MSYADSIQQLQDAACLPVRERHFQFSHVAAPADPKALPKSFIGVRSATIAPCTQCSGWIKVYSDEETGQCRCGAVIKEVPQPT